jgi:hypothetical protein
VSPLCCVVGGAASAVRYEGRPWPCSAAHTTTAGTPPHRKHRDTTREATGDKSPVWTSTTISIPNFIPTLLRAKASEDPTTIAAMCAAIIDTCQATRAAGLGALARSAFTSQGCIPVLVAYLRQLSTVEGCHYGTAILVLSALSQVRHCSCHCRS